ncbi:hypothetical protein FT643_06815 [Ketobacter sp. MCCC 1A13808]|nr:hypothetical protein [Ketobacter sp. MCCC 1A13808]
MICLGLNESPSNMRTIFNRDTNAASTPAEQRRYFESEAIGKQNSAMALSAGLLHQEIAEARTLGFEDQIESLKKSGLAQGGSLRNATEQWADIMDVRTYGEVLESASFHWSAFRSGY